MRPEFKKNVSCIILAGGKSRRMGRDKKFLLYDGKTFLERAVETAKSLSDEVIISLGSKEQRDEVLSKDYNVITVVDQVKDKGPLAGLLTALRRCTREYTTVMPCDTPLLTRRVFLDMLEKCEGWDGVVPVVRGLPEPLVAVYRVKPFLSACEEAVKAGQWRVGGVIRRLGRVRYLTMDTREFLNVNTPRDMEEVQKYGREDEGVCRENAR